METGKMPVLRSGGAREELRNYKLLIENCKLKIEGQPSTFVKPFTGRVPQGFSGGIFRSLPASIFRA